MVHAGDGQVYEQRLVPGILPDGVLQDGDCLLRITGCFESARQQTHGIRISTGTFHRQQCGDCGRIIFGAPVRQGEVISGRSILPDLQERSKLFRRIAPPLPVHQTYSVLPLDGGGFKSRAGLLKMNKSASAGPAFKQQRGHHGVCGF